MSRGSSAPGFMLVEALAALAILSAVLIATYAALSSALSVSARVALRRDAVFAVERQVEALRSGGRLQAGVSRGVAGPYRWRVEVSLLAAAPGQRLRPLRVLGQILPDHGKSAAETVVDTVILGRVP